MLSTSDIKNEIIKYVAISIFVGFISFVYELFSHNVYSFFMVYAFLPPFILGVIINILILVFNNMKISKLTNSIYNHLISTLIIGFLLKGALDIYGTTNNLLIVFQIICIILIIQIFITLNLSKNINWLWHYTHYYV
jgi:hypothetical protein